MYRNATDYENTPYHSEFLTKDEAGLEAVSLWEQNDMLDE